MSLGSVSSNLDQKKNGSENVVCIENVTRLAMMLNDKVIYVSIRTVRKELTEERRTDGLK